MVVQKGTFDPPVGLKSSHEIWPQNQQPKMEAQSLCRSTMSLAHLEPRVTRFQLDLRDYQVPCQSSHRGCWFWVARATQNHQPSTLVVEIGLHITWTMVKKSSLYPDYMGNCCEHVWGGCWYWVSRATQSQQLKWRLLILCSTCNTISTTQVRTPSIGHFS